MTELSLESTLPLCPVTRPGRIAPPAGVPIPPECVCGGPPNCRPEQEESQAQNKAAEEGKGSEGPARQTPSETRLESIQVPPKTKTGNLAAPRFSTFIFAVVALFSVSGGTHRVRGVMASVDVLSPVESSSPPRLFEQQFPSTPVRRL